MNGIDNMDSDTAGNVGLDEGWINKRCNSGNACFSESWLSKSGNGRTSCSGEGWVNEDGNTGGNMCSGKG